MTTLLTLPAIPAATIDWQFLSKSEAYPSPFTGDEQVASYPAAARWMAVLTWSLLSRTEAALLEAFLVACNGKAGRFLLSNQARRLPRGSAPGTPVVDGNGNYGGLLATRGWTANRSGVLLPGDYVSVQNELKMVLAEASSNADGKATLTISPNLRKVPVDGMAVVTAAAPGIFRLLDDNQAKFAYRKQTGDYQVTTLEIWS